MTATSSSERRIVVTNRDHERLLAALNRLGDSSAEDKSAIENLTHRLMAAGLADQREVPRSLVTMNSLVGLRDLELNRKLTCTLAYPDEADVLKHRVSVTASLGTELLGRRVGDVVECPVPSGVRSLRIEQVYYQPEAAGHFHL
jgi:regulator of nucleoside diphosphate kinase